MKKYFVEGIDEPLEFGDTIGLDIIKEKDGKSVKKNIEIPFTPELLPLLLEEGVIVEKDVEETGNGGKGQQDGTNQPDNDEEDLDDVLDDIYASIDDIHSQINRLSKRISAIEKENTPAGSDHDVDKKRLNDYINRHWDILKPLHNWTYSKGIDNICFDRFGFTF